MKNRKNLLMRSLSRGALLLLCFGLMATFSTAQSQSPDSTLEPAQLERPKTMPERQFNNLIAGRGMGLARAAELNGYPGPMHVLELADELEITDQQRAQTQQIMQRMRSSAQQLGREIIQAEAQLGSLFDGGRVQPSQMDGALLEIANLNARLRATHLRAHLEQAGVLNEEQLAKYAELRSNLMDSGRGRAGRGNRQRNTN